MRSQSRKCKPDRKTRPTKPRYRSVGRPAGCKRSGFTAASCPARNPVASFPVPRLPRGQGSSDARRTSAALVGTTWRGARRLPRRRSQQQGVGNAACACLEAIVANRPRRRDRIDRYSASYTEERNL